MSAWVIADISTSLPAGSAAAASKRSNAERKERQTIPALDQAPASAAARCRRDPTKTPASTA
jgi:hypothetical protein